MAPNPFGTFDNPSYRLPPPDHQDIRETTPTHTALRGPGYYSVTSTPESPRLAAQAIVVNREGKFLVAEHPQKKEARWRFPGGKLESKEAPAAAARRELYEEVGVWADPFGFKPLGTEDVYIDGDFWRVHYFLVPATEWIGRPQSREENKLGDVRWVTKAELLGMDISENMRAVVERALRP